MNESKSNTVTSPSPSVIRRREELCDEFEANLKAGSRPNPQEYLEQVSEQDRSTLLFELNALIQAYHPQTERTSNPQVADNLDTTLPANTKEHKNEQLPERVGKYNILGRLGEGAMGIVYRAHHPVLKRDIALKTIRPQNVRKWGETERILMEARSVAKLKHPHVIAIHDADVADGQPYFTMALVEGGTLQSHLDEYRYGTSQKTECENQFNLTSTGWSRKQIAARKNKILVLMEKVCRAVHAAHAHVPTIIHRDVKPGNILLDGDEPRVSDFGLAKSISPDDEEHFSEAGTPPYMSPEQYRGESKDILATSDIWALGVILYELFTGRRPFWGVTRRDIKQAVLNTEPQRPREWNKLIDLDLDAVILKCLQKDTSRRYQSAADLSDDLARCREGIPIPIRPIRQTERLRRWTCRKPAQAVLCVLMILTAGAAIALFVQDQRHKAQFARAERIKSADETSKKGDMLCRQGDASQGIIWLARSFEIAPADEIEQRERIRTSIAKWLSHINPLMEMFDEQSPVLSVAFSPNGKSFATGMEDGSVRVRNSNTFGMEWTAKPHPKQVLAMSFSPDSKKILTGCLDGIARLWDLSLSSDKPQLQFPHNTFIFAVVFSNDGKTIFTGGGNGIVKVWDAESGQLRRELPSHQDQVQSLAISSDDKTLVVATVLAKIKTPTGSITRWDVETGRQTERPYNYLGPVLTVAFCPDIRSIVSGSESRALRLNLDFNTEPLAYFSHGSLVRSVAISRNGATTITGGDDMTVKIWNTTTGESVGAPLYHRDIVRSVAIDPNDSLILAGCRDGIARLWQRSPPSNVPTHHLETWAQGLTGIEIDETEKTRPFKAKEWHQLRIRLKELGVPTPR